MTLRNIACRIKKSAMGTVVVAAASLIASTGALAGDATETAPACDVPKPPAAAESAGKTAPGLVVTIDRETGRLRPATAAERAALAAVGGRHVLARTGQATLVETRADGSKHARLGPEFSHWSVARAKADGTVSYDCVPAGKVGAALNATAPAAPAAPEK
jgi:hypothetical protein